MQLERRRHFRQPVGLAAKVRLAGPPPSEEVAARATDLSPSGTMLILERLPGWGFNLASSQMRVEFSLDMGRCGELRGSGQLRRIITDDDGCQLGVQFARLEGDGAVRLGRFLENSADREDNEAVRERRSKHTRRRRWQIALVVGLFLVAAAGISAAMMGALQAVPEWGEKLKAFVHSTAHDAARDAIEDEKRRLRRDPGGSPSTQTPGPGHDQQIPLDPGDVRELRDSLTPEEKARIEREIRERLERAKPPQKTN